MLQSHVMAFQLVSENTDNTIDVCEDEREQVNSMVSSE